jgi:TatD DNase family protein
MFIDSHAHLTGGGFTDSELSELLERSLKAQVNEIINICTDLPSLEKGLALSKQYPWVHLTAATTPHDVEKEGEEAFETIASCARSKQLVAIGETGLDYHYTYSAKEIQKSFLIRYLQLALECGLPVVIHCREAFADLFSIIDDYYQINGRHAPGVLHCFTGTKEEALQVLERGWFLSLSGIVTFKKSDELREVAKLTSLNQLLIETDSPYLAPQSHRGKTNEPSFLPEIAETIARVKGVSIGEVASAISTNAKRLFHI